MTLDIRPATLEDAEWIAPRLREQDRREIETATGKTPEAVLPTSVSQSLECYVARPFGQENPCVIFGLYQDRVDPAVGLVWLMATPEVTRAAKAVLLESRVWINKWLSKFDYLANIVDVRNTLHIRWISRLGFTFGQRVTVNGHTFRYFFKRKDPSNG